MTPRRPHTTTRSISLNLLLFIMFVTAAFSLALASRAQSVASLPVDWRTWVAMPKSVVPGNDVILPSDTPLFLVQTIQWINSVTDGRATEVNIFVNPAKLAAYRRGGPYPDGPTAVLTLEGSRYIFVTEHFLGEALYGVYDTSGRDATDAGPAFEIQTCVNCHNENSDICQAGTCRLSVRDAFQNWGQTDD